MTRQTSTARQTRQTRAIETPACPACSCERGTLIPTGTAVYTCERCGCLHGRLYLGESYTLVQPYFEAEAVAAAAIAAGETRPYDLDCLGSGGLTRRHGWYNPATRRITQTG
jgi:ribosomal protein L37AE/L43A